MNTNIQETDLNDVIPDKKNIPLMIQAAWYLLVSGLFVFKNYNMATEKTAKAFIRSFIEAGADPYKAYLEFCQRIFMARHYIFQHSGYHFTSSILSWLDPDNKHGFAGTATWFNKLQEKRTIQPTYLLELKAFPEAMLELAEEPAKDNFHYWAEWFIEREARDQYLMLQMVGVKMVFGEREER